MARYNSNNQDSDGETGMLITRRLDMGSGDYNVGFKMYRGTAWKSYVDKIDVYVNTQPNTTGATLLGTVNRHIELEPVVSTAGWHDYVFNIPTSYVENPSYIILLATSGWGANMFVDELVVGQKRTVTLAANPVAGGTVSDGGFYFQGGIVAGSGIYAEGTEIEITATPNAGYQFINWTNADGDTVSTEATFNHVVGSSDTTFTANFGLEYTVTFMVGVSGNPVENATIVVNETTLTTNAAGEATIKLVNGTYPYTVTKLDYSAITGNFSVTGANRTVIVSMQVGTYEPYDVTAEVVNNNQAAVAWNPSFFDDIESYEDFIIDNIGNYTLVDVDGSGTYTLGGVTYPNQNYTGSFIVFNPSATTPPLTDAGYAPHSGSKYLGCFAAMSPPNDDWLISHQVTVVPGMRFSFWAKSGPGFTDYFRVGVSTTGTAPADFTIVSAGVSVEAPTDWTQFTYSLDAYVGQTVYLAINCVSYNEWILMIDDIYIGGPKVGESETLLGYKVYLNDVLKSEGLTTTKDTITNIPIGTHAVGVRAVYTSGESAIVYADSITIMAPTYNVTFNVVDGASSPVEDATITISSHTLTTNSSGEAIVALVDGTYSYTASKTGYIDATGNVTVAGADTTINVTLIYDEFTLTLEANPVAGGTVTGGGNYASGATVNIKATPATGYNFVNWTKAGTSISTNAEYEYTMPSENVTLVANFEAIPTYPVTFAVVDSASVPVAGASVIINSDTLATNALGIATINLPDETYPYTVSKIGFIDVTGSVTVAGVAPDTIDITLIHEQYTLTLVAFPSVGGTLTGAGNYTMGTPVVIGATPATGYNFVKWTKDGVEISTSAIHTYTMPNENVTLVANFAGESSHAVTFTVADTASNPIAGASIAINSETLTTSATGEAIIYLADGTYPYTVSKAGFENATGDAIVSGANITVNVTLTPTAIEEFTVTFTVKDAANVPIAEASIAINEETLTTNASGVATIDLANGAYAYTVSKTGYVDATDSVTVDGAPVSVDVTLTPQTYTLTLVADPVAGGTVSGGGDYQADSIVNVTATANTGYNFINWTKDGVEVNTSPTFDYTMPSENVTLTANFATTSSHTVTFAVADTANNPVEGATVTINSQTRVTNASGIAAINLEDGAYAYTVTKAGYEDATDSVTVNGADTTVNVTLTPVAIEEFTVTFTVKDTANNPIAEASIAINEETLTTDASGVATIDLANGAYAYTVTKAGYEDATDSVTVEGADVSVNVALTPTSTPLFTLTLAANPTDGGTVTGGGEYQEGDSITVKATPATGYNFVSWTKGTDTVSISPEFVYAMPAENVTLTANFETIPTSTVTFMVAGSNSMPVDGATVLINSDTLTTDAMGVLTIQLPDGTYEYTVSKGGYTTVTDSVVVGGGFVMVNVTLMPLPHFYTVTFTVTDTTDTPIADATVFVNYQLYTTDASGVATATLVNGTHYYTINKLGYTSVTGSVVVNEADVEVDTVLIHEEYSLTLVANPAEGGTLSDSVSNYHYGDTVTVEATPATGYSFVNWTMGDYEISSTPQFSYVMPALDVTLTANFDTLNIVTFVVTDSLDNPVGSAKVVINEDSIYTSASGIATFALDNGTYAYAVSGTGYLSVTDSITVNDEDVTINVKLPYANLTLTLIANPVDGGTFNFESKECHVGEEVTVIATPAEGFSFVNWTMFTLPVSTDAEFVYTMPATDVTLTANFDSVPKYNVTFTVVDATSTPIEGAGIAIGSEVLATDASGVATFALANGSHTYIASKPGYEYVIDTVTVDGADVSVNVTLNPQSGFILALVANPAEGGSVTGNGIYQEGDSVTVVATPAQGYNFVNWTKGEDVVSETAEFVYTMPAENVVLTANFEEGPTAYTVTFTIVDSESTPIVGANVMINSETLTTDTTGVTTIELVDGTYAYTVSKDGYATVTDSVVVDGADVAVNVTLTLIPQEFALTLVANPAEGGTVAGGGNYQAGATVNVTATANTGYNFVNWTKGEDVVSTVAEFEYTMPGEDVTLTANFEAIPTHTVTFTVVDAANAPIEDASVVINSETLTTNASGVATISLVDGTYAYTVTKIGYSEATGDVVVDGADVPVSVTLTLQEYTLTLVANPVEGGTVNDSVANGNYHYGDVITVAATPAEEYRFVNWTKASDGSIVSTNAEFAYTMPAEDVTLKANFAPASTFTVTFTVADIEDTPISGAEIIINEDTLVTNPQGIAITYLNNGEYNYSVTKLGYHGVTGSLVVDSADVNEFVTMELVAYEITFQVNFSGAPLEGVTINVADTLLTTDVYGKAVIQLVNGTYTYTATKDNYDDSEGEFTVENAAQTITVNMTGIGESSIANLVKLYPNPVENTLTIERNSSDEVVMEIYNINGALVGSIKTDNMTTTIDVGMLGSGAYFVRIVGANEATVHRFIKR